MCGFEVFCDVKVGNLILQTAIFDIFCNVPGWVLRLNEGYTLSFQVEIYLSAGGGALNLLWSNGFKKKIGLHE